LSSFFAQSQKSLNFRFLSILFFKISEIHPRLLHVMHYAREHQQLAIITSLPGNIKVLLYGQFNVASLPRKDDAVVALWLAISGVWLSLGTLLLT